MDSDPDQDTTEVIWATQDDPIKITVDPAADLRAVGSESKFWGNEASPSPPAACSLGTSPSTTSLIKRAAHLGLSSVQIEQATQMLQDSAGRAQIMADSSPSSMDRPTSTARKLVTSLFAGKSRSAGRWQGPLPPRRVSPPLTLGDCVTEDRRRRNSGNGRPRHRVGDEVQNSKGDPVSSVGQARPSPGFWIKKHQSWVRVPIRSRVGSFLSRRGTLPIQFRAHIPKLSWWRRRDLRSCRSAGDRDGERRQPGRGL